MCKCGYAHNNFLVNISCHRIRMREHYHSHVRTGHCQNKDLHLVIFSKNEYQTLQCLAGQNYINLKYLLNYIYA